MSERHGLKFTTENRVSTRLVPHLSTLIVARLSAVPILELQHLVIQEVEENPCLEIESWDPPQIDIIEETTKETPEITPDENELLPTWPRGIISNNEDDDTLEPEAPPIGFWDRVEAQVEVNFARDKRRYRIARTIIDSLDERGRLSLPVEIIARRLGVEVDEVEKVRQFILREFDPPGIAAVNLRETLLVQLEQRNLTDSLLYKAISEHWDEAKRGLREYISRISPNDEEKEENLKLLESLYLFPSTVYEHESIAYIYPEVIFKERDGRIVVELVRGMYPMLAINSYYASLLDDPNVDKKTKRFIKEKLDRARIYIEALASRRRNIAMIAEFIALNQEDFLLGRSKYLKPITQLEAAERLGMSESTLSRIVRGKYAETPVGIFELKFFFSRGVMKNGRVVSKDRMIDRMLQIIESEDKANPLSDEKIASILRKEGYKISRRTVVKYRQQLGIPSSKARKNKK